MSSSLLTRQICISSLINSLVKTHKFHQSLILFKNANSSLSSSILDLSIFPSLLQSCVQLSLLNLGKCIHGYVSKRGFSSSIDINTSFVELYLNFCKTKDACQLFGEMPIRDQRYFNFVIPAFGSSRSYIETLDSFEESISSGFTPFPESVRRAIIACGELRMLDKGRWIHGYVINHGFDNNILICNALISMYVKMGELDSAHDAFDSMENRDLVSYNTLISGYTQSRNWSKALGVFQSMKESGGDIVHNNVTLIALVFICAHSGNLNQGMSIHGHCIRRGWLADPRLGTAILDMYAKCGKIECAGMLFEEEAFEKTLVSWNSLIVGYSKGRYYRKAIDLFKRMFVCSSFKADSFTLSNVIPAYADVRSIEGIRSIHGLILKQGIDMEAKVVLATTMVDAYGKCSDVVAAERLFYDIKVPDTSTWNSMLTGYHSNECADKGVLLFRKMLKSRVLPDTITITKLLQLFGLLESLKLGSMAHGFVLINGFSSHLKVGTALLDMYFRCKSMENAEQYFRLMDYKSIVTWNAMLSGYVKIASFAPAIRMFGQMQLKGVNVGDSVTFISLVQASAAFLTSYGTDVAHAYIIKLGFDSETMVINSLIDAYAKNGCIGNASSLFAHMGRIRDECSWNVMIAGYGMNGRGEKGCELVDQMIENGYRPDNITFTSLLSACAHSGLIDEGCKYFEMMMKNFKIQPSLEHWTCIINMLGRAGNLEEAYKLIRTSEELNLPGAVPSVSAAIWGTFMDACRMYTNIELGEIAGRKLLELLPENSGYPILLSQLYSSTKKWDEAVKARQLISEGVLVKETAFSSISR
ncbi:unnamed protein product [Amaranthus hypochondriacus]